MIMTRYAFPILVISNRDNANAIKNDNSVTNLKNMILTPPALLVRNVPGEACVLSPHLRPSCEHQHPLGT